MLYRIVRLIIYPFVKLIYRIHVKGMENIPENIGFVLCSNHVSMADVFILTVMFKRSIHYMGKEELFKNRFLGWFFTKLGCFSVKRGKGDYAALDKACEYITQGEIFGIFPEGTRNYGERPSKAKAGAAVVAARTGASILPVALKYSTKKAKPFCRVTLHIGNIIDISSNHTDDESQRAEIRRVSDTITDAIVKLWEAEV